MLLGNRSGAGAQAFLGSSETPLLKLVGSPLALWIILVTRRPPTLGSRLGAPPQVVGRNTIFAGRRLANLSTDKVEAVSREHLRITYVRRGGRPGSDGSASGTTCSST